MSGLRLYLRLLGVSLRAQLQYRLSFALSALAALLASGIELLGVWALFARFGRLDAWSLEQVCVFYGIVNVAFALAESLSAGFDSFGPLYIRTGQFDRVLLRPRSPVLQLLGHELTLRRVGRLVQGLAVLVWGYAELGLPLGAREGLLLALAVLGAMSLFLGLLVCQGTLAFWTVESLEVMNILTYGGVQTAQYPLDIYAPAMQRFFIYVIPLGCVTYFPVLTLLGETGGYSAWIGWASPLAGPAFLAAALLVFSRFGIAHYRSTGS